MIMNTAFRVIKDFILSYNGAHYSSFLSSNETVDVVLKGRKSLIRYGDGEFNYLEGKSVHYQKKDPDLKKYLADILEDFMINKDVPYLVCMPGRFLSCKGYRLLKKKSYFISWPFSRRIFVNKYDGYYTYGDAFLFAEENKNNYTKLWKESNVNNLILVHNDEKYLHQLKNDSEKKCSFIKVPEKDSFNEFKNILANIEVSVDEIGKNDCMVIICAGPCAKALVYELSKKGIWAIDAGHCFCTPLHVMK